MLSPFSLRHSSVIAEPDEEVYISCLRRYVEKGTFDRMKSETLIDHFNEQALLYRIEKETTKKDSIGTRSAINDYPDRSCSRQQRLVVNASFVAKEALQSAELFCKANLSF